MISFVAKAGFQLAYLRILQIHCVLLIPFLPIMLGGLIPSKTGAFLEACHANETSLHVHALDSQNDDPDSRQSTAISRQLRQRYVLQGERQLTSL